MEGTLWGLYTIISQGASACAHLHMCAQQVYLCVLAPVLACTHACVYMYANVHMCIMGMHVYMYICMMCAGTYMCVCVYSNPHVYMCVHMHVCVYKCCVICMCKYVYMCVPVLDWSHYAKLKAVD